MRAYVRNRIWNLIGTACPWYILRMWIKSHLPVLPALCTPVLCFYVRESVCRSCHVGKLDQRSLIRFCQIFFFFFDKNVENDKIKTNNLNW